MRMREIGDASHIDHFFLEKKSMTTEIQSSCISDVTALKIHSISSSQRCM